MGVRSVYKYPVRRNIFAVSHVTCRVKDMI